VTYCSGANAKSIEVEDSTGSIFQDCKILEDSERNRTAGTQADRATTDVIITTTVDFYQMKVEWTDAAKTREIVS